ncbi:type II secretion system F family protein [Ornithinimicrobium ciconiae]|uniref:Type II secretion system F family protein n=1 Tax=Ornithinimicrobium ciconiae TaxID=2594265 RepID=A0A516GEJ1_9MICO|nr:type II secretion system F family protein [Ornithinimicrobium ciconiae]QDO89953.1 type II secretion system F family protein [Ornithinimicrobium ciconiae]
MTWSLLPAALVALAVLVWPTRQRAPAFVPGPDGGGVAGATGARVLRAAAPWRRSQVEPELAVPDVLDLVALALDAGASTTAALRAAADRLPGRGGTELRAVAAALEWGIGDEAAWSAAPHRWEPAGRALRLASHAGVPPAGLLRRAAEDARRERLHAVEAATARLGVRLVLPLGLAFLPAFVLTAVVPVVLALAGQLLGGSGQLLP